MVLMNEERAQNCSILNRHQQIGGGVVIHICFYFVSSTSRSVVSISSVSTTISLLSNSVWIFCNHRNSKLKRYHHRSRDLVHIDQDNLGYSLLFV